MGGWTDADGGNFLTWKCDPPEFPGGEKLQIGPRPKLSRGKKRGGPLRALIISDKPYIIPRSYYSPRNKRN